MTRLCACYLTLLAFSACQHSDEMGDAGAVVDPCEILFGNPNNKTGLGSDQCRPECVCGHASFRPPAYSAAFVQSLKDDWQLATPYAPISSDPYVMPLPAASPPGTVCGMLPRGAVSDHPRFYDLVTYSSQSAASAAGAQTTHFGPCGVCSTLSNLAVYMRNNDLTAPVRSCAFATSSDGGDPDLDCLLGLGFDLPCAQIWAFNTAHTRSVCLKTCLENFTAPYNLPDGTLNPCLQCDEDQSGPIFKAYGGRTRRNSALPNAICRPCSEVQPLIHQY